MSDNSGLLLGNKTDGVHFCLEGVILPNTLKPSHLAHPLEYVRQLAHIPVVGEFYG